MEIITYLRTIDQDILILIITGFLLVLFFITLDLVTSIYKIKKRTKKKIKMEAPIIEELQDQLSIVSNHASNYANTLGQEGSKLLQELKTIVEEQTKTLEMLEYYLNNDQVEDLKDFYKKYDENTPHQKYFWISRSKHVMELLGRKLYEVSERSTNLGLPKVKRKENTIQSLKRWNIIK